MENVQDHMVSTYVGIVKVKEAGHPPQVQDEWPLQHPVLQQRVAKSTTQPVTCMHFGIIIVYHRWILAYCLLLNETITILMHAWLCKEILYVGEDKRINVHGKFVLFKIKLEKKVVQVHL